MQYSNNYKSQRDKQELIKSANVRKAKQLLVIWLKNKKERNIINFVNHKTATTSVTKVKTSVYTDMWGVLFLSALTRTQNLSTNFKGYHQYKFQENLSRRRWVFPREGTDRQKSGRIDGRIDKWTQDKYIVAFYNAFVKRLENEHN